MKNDTNTGGNMISEQIIRQVIASWTSRNTLFTGFFNKYKDEETYLNEVAPGRNRAIYLLGHLIAVNDGMLPIFGLGEKLFPELEALFIKAPDKTVEELPSLAELRLQWEQLNAKLTEHFSTMATHEWMERHTLVSPEDFEQNPSRNKLNVLLGRTIHQSYHLGQMNLLNV